MTYKYINLPRHYGHGYSLHSYLFKEAMYRYQVHATKEYILEKFGVGRSVNRVWTKPMLGVIAMSGLWAHWKGL